jgi:O-antigen ligase
VSAGWALAVTRAAAIAVAVGAIASPPLASFASAVMALAFFFIPDWRARLRRSLGTRLGRGVLVFAAALLLATVLGAFGPQGVRGAVAHLFGWRTLLVLVLAFAVFDCARWKERLAFAFVAFTAFAAVVALVALKMGWVHRDLPAGILLRNTVTQAMAFAIGAFFAAMLLATRRTASRARRIFLAGAGLLLLWQLLFVQVGRSGQAMLAVLVAVVAALHLRGARRVLAIGAVPVAAALAFSLSPVMQARFATAWQEFTHVETLTEYTSMGIRAVMWQNTVELIQARPVLGYGLGGMRPAYAALVAGRAEGWKAIVTGDPHNQLLAVWVDAGLPGVLAFIFMLAAIGLQPAPKPWRSLALALLGAWCATSMMSSHFQTFNEGHLIAVFLGAFLAPAGPDEPSAQVAASAPSTAASTSS